MAQYNSSTLSTMTYPNALFLSIEGIEGAGKSTQIELLKGYLESLSHDVIILREPGGTAFGEKLRQAILGSKSPITPIAEAYLFASSRAQLLSEKIIPFLKSSDKDKKKIVILDRYIDSSFAYQGVARGLGIQTIIDIHSKGILSNMPRRTYYLNIDIETSFERQRKRNNDKDYFESQSLEFYHSIKDGLDQASQIFKDRILVIDAGQTSNEVFQAIKKDINELLNE